jgi:hypothetical protein
MTSGPWTFQQLRAELERYENELQAAGKEPRTISTYVGQSERFVRFLTGDYRPDARADRTQRGHQRPRP